MGFPVPRGCRVEFVYLPVDPAPKVNCASAPLPDSATATAFALRGLFIALFPDPESDPERTHHPGDCLRGCQAAQPVGYLQLPTLPVSEPQSVSGLGRSLVSSWIRLPTTVGRALSSPMFKIAALPADV